MDFDTIKHYALKFKNARNNLLLVVIFSAANLFLTIFNSDVYLLFSATIPQFIFEVGRGLAEEFQSNVFLTIGLFIAFIAIILYFICWIFAKRFRAFILVAFILFAIDTLMFGLITLAVGFEASYSLDIIFHGWILFYLINGVIAWAKLRGASSDDVNAVMQEISAAAKGVQPNDGTLDSRTSTDVSQNDKTEGVSGIISETTPLRVDDKKGRILIASYYEGLQIDMKRTRGLTELIVNGNVYDEIKGIIEYDYSLAANVQGIKIAGMFSSKKSHMYLYANDVLIAKKLRLY